MKIEFDPAKSEKNARARIALFVGGDLRLDDVQAKDDNRFSYPERRVIATGFIGNRLHVVCFTPVDGGVRVISFRKANDREIGKYEKEKTPNR